MVLNMTENEKWDYFPHVWKTEAQYLDWLRGNIRNIWKTCPQKLEFLKSKTLKLPRYDSEGNAILYKNGKAKLLKAYVCNYCDKICYDTDKIGFRKTYAVDHITGNHSLTSVSDIESFTLAMLKVRLEDLQILCNDCHDIKSYSEKYRITLSEALIQKKIIQIIKNNQDKQFFIERGLQVPSNLKSRKNAMTSILNEELNNDNSTQQ